jgi:hypothetical protein
VELALEAIKPSASECLSFGMESKVLSYAPEQIHRKYTKLRILVNKRRRARKSPKFQIHDWVIASLTTKFAQGFRWRRKARFVGFVAPQPSASLKTRAHNFLELDREVSPS